LLIADQETVTVDGAEHEVGHAIWELRRLDLERRIGKKGRFIPRWQREFLDELGMQWNPGGLGLGAEREQEIIDAVGAEIEVVAADAAAGQDADHPDPAVREAVAQARARTDAALAEQGTETQGAVEGLRGMRALMQVWRARGDLVMAPHHHEL